MLHIPKLREVRVRREGTRVLLIETGRLILDMPWQAADDLARAIRAQARKAEEQEKAAAIVDDNAILIRAGAPFGLSSRLDILKESLKEAVWGSRLRRMMPGGIKSRELFGTPAIIKHPPKEIKK